MASVGSLGGGLSRHVLGVGALADAREAVQLRVVRDGEGVGRALVATWYLRLHALCDATQHGVQGASTLTVPVNSSEHTLTVRQDIS